MKTAPLDPLQKLFIRRDEWKSAPVIAGSASMCEKMTRINFYTTTMHCFRTLMMVWVSSLMVNPSLIGVDASLMMS